MSVGMPGDRFEREAEAAASEVMENRSLSRSAISQLGQLGIQRYSWKEFVSDLKSGVDAVADAPGEVADTIEGVAKSVWHTAQAFAASLGGTLSFSGGVLRISVPPLDICRGGHSLQFSLPEIGVDFPFAFGAIPLGPVEIYGELAVHVGFTPEISAQLGPCSLTGFGITIDPLAPSFSAGGGIDVTMALGLGAETHLGLHGEVGVIIIWPDPPLIIKIPAVALEGGLAGFVRGIAADHLRLSGGITYSGGTFSGGLSDREDIGLALDFGLAGYGSLQVLGQNLCTLYWPLFQHHMQAVVSGGVDAGLAVDSSGATASYVPQPIELNRIPFADLGIQIQRNMFKDDCPLCDFLRDLGLMPSKIGGPWPFHPTPPWAVGPLSSVYPRDPHIPSGALCRGACGPNCKTCAHEKDHRVCVETGTGCHEWWVYPNYEVCNSHPGCRSHDACYDWCSAVTGFKGPLGIALSPCHRWCDFECLCDYNLPQCVGWIFGKPPYDQQMVFSDMPHKEPGCSGPCPKDGKTPATPMKLCLPDLIIVGRRSVFHKGFSHSTGDIVIFSIPLKIPYIPPPNLDVFVRGELSASADAGVGPVTLERLCLVYDPTSHAYAGTGSVHLKGDLSGLLNLTGIVGAKAGWGCLLNAIDLEVIRGEAGLSATGSLHIPLDLSTTATVSCRGGKLILDLDTLFTACLDLKFKLDASLRVLLFKRFEIFKDKWTLKEHQLGHCWDIPIEVTRGEIGSAACGGGTAAGALGLPAPSGPPAAVGVPGAGGGPGPSSTSAGLSHVELGNVDTLSVKGLITDLFKLATQKEVIHDKTHGGLPADPAKAAGKENPCGKVKPDDECGSPQLPDTGPLRFTGTDRGEEVRVRPLTKCGPPGSSPRKGTLPAFNCIPLNERNSWARAHLLNENLHGPGENPNLIIADRFINNQMPPRIENPLKDRILSQNQVFDYLAIVVHEANAGDRRFFARRIEVAAQQIDPITGNSIGPALADNFDRVLGIPGTCT
jgi:hypothetical protein